MTVDHPLDDIGYAFYAFAALLLTLLTIAS